MASESRGVPITVKCRIGVVDRVDVGGGGGALASRLDLDEATFLKHKIYVYLFFLLASNVNFR
jgi:hypothetical protein